MTPSVERLTGYTAEEYIEGGLELSASRVHPDDMAKLDSHINELLVDRHVGEVEPTIEYRTRRRDGEYHWFSDTRSVVYDDAGEGIAIVGNSRDVTDRTQAARDLTENKQQLDDFFDSSPAGLQILDDQLRYVRVNTSLAEMNGVPVEQHLGRSSADPGQVEQVIMNLIINARDAMPTGGRVSIETSNVGLGEEGAQEVAAEPGSYVLLSIADEGVGIDDETQQRIFEPFFTTKEAGVGTGLATVYGIIKQSDGFVSVESEPGEGTTFKVYFPRIETAASAPAELKPASALGGTETLLVVEDEDAVRNLTRRIVMAAGYTLHTAANAGEALLQYERSGNDIRLVLSDVIMPQMSGLELIRRLTRSARTCKCSTCPATPAMRSRRSSTTPARSSPNRSRPPHSSTRFERPSTTLGLPAAEPNRATRSSVHRGLGFESGRFRAPILQ
jgi:PAS domain S-box-containing protein